MWARIIECMLGFWLALSPFIFHAPKTEKLFWMNDLSCSALLVIFSLLSFYRPLEKIHLCNLLVGIWLFSFGYFFELPLPGSPQHVVLEKCEAQVSKVQGAAESGLRIAEQPKAGCRCSATQQVASLRKQVSALHVKDYPLPNYVQNDVLIGILLLILAIVPCRAETPPESWQEFKL